MKNIVRFISLIALSFFIVHCGNTKKTIAGTDTALNGTWELNYIARAPMPFDSLFPKIKPTIIFNLPDTLARGNGGCNGYSCHIKITGYQIRFGDALSTMMYCEPGGEQVYFKTLKTISSYSVSDGNTLNLMMGDMAVMRFTKK
jgi:heat shock protein HslJ